MRELVHVLQKDITRPKATEHVVKTVEAFDGRPYGNEYLRVHLGDVLEILEH